MVDAERTEAQSQGAQRRLKGVSKRELLLQAGREGIEAEELIDRLFRDVVRFRAGAAQEDDVTAIAVRVKG